MRACCALAAAAAALAAATLAAAAAAPAAAAFASFALSATVTVLAAAAALHARARAPVTSPKAPASLLPISSYRSMIGQSSSGASGSKDGINNASRSARNKEVRAYASALNDR